MTYMVLQKEKVVILCSDISISTDLLKDGFRLMLSTTDYTQACSYYVMLKNINHEKVK